MSSFPMTAALSMEQRLRTAEATNEIIRLKSLYAEFADAKYTDAFEKKPQAERDEVAWRQARCFTEDGEFSAGAFGDVNGHQALFENFRAKPFLFAVHMFTNPVIDVDASVEAAAGRWLHHLMVKQEGTLRCLHGMGYTYGRYRCADNLVGAAPHELPTSIRPPNRPWAETRPYQISRKSQAQSQRIQQPCDDRKWPKSS